MVRGFIAASERTSFMSTIREPNGTYTFDPYDEIRDGVYKAQWESDQGIQNVLLKIGSRDERKKIERENAIFTHLNAMSPDHPFIRPLNYFETDELARIAFPFIEEAYSFEHVETRTKQLSLPEIADIVVELGGQFEIMHKANTIHADVKPSNILLVPDEERVKAYIIDFGASHGPGLGSIAKAGRFYGTLPYCPPETVQGASPSVATDVYGLGMTVLAGLSNGVYSRHTYSTTIHSKTRGEYPREIYELRDQGKKKIAEIIAYAIEPVMERRCPSPLVFAKAFQEAVKNEKSKETNPLVRFYRRFVGQ